MLKSLLGAQHQQMACAAVVIVVLLAIAATVASAPLTAARGKQRTTRGFKNAALSTARGFGKRSGLLVPAAVDMPDPLTDLFARIHRPKAASVASSYPQQESDSMLDPLSGLYLRVQNIDSESVPVEWFAEEMSNNPELARSLVNKFDRNQDGELSADEFLRPTY